MAYDMLVSGLTMADTATVTRFQELLERYKCTACGSKGAQTVRFDLNDADASAFFKALVQVASNGGLVLAAPYTGAHIDLSKPGRYPPGWLPSGPVPGASLNAKMKNLMQDYLAPRGFELRRKGVMHRNSSATIAQGIWLTPGTSSRSGLLRAKAIWTFSGAPGRADRGDSVLSVEGLQRATDGQSGPAPPRWEWLPVATAAEVELSFERLLRQLDQIVLPLFDMLHDVNSIVQSYESGQLDGIHLDGAGRRTPAVKVAFGSTKTCAGMAWCYHHLGRLAAGKARYFDYLADAERAPPTYRYRPEGARPGQSKAAQRAKQDAQLATWFKDERERATVAFRWV